jgi:hypothetical protein
MDRPATRTGRLRHPRPPRQSVVGRSREGQPRLEAQPTHVTTGRALQRENRPHHAGRPRRPAAPPRTHARTSEARSTADAGARSPPGLRSAFQPSSPAPPDAPDTHREPPSARRLLCRRSSCERRPFEPGHATFSPASAAAPTDGPASRRRSAARASFFICFSSRFSRSACSRARFNTDCGDLRAISNTPSARQPRPFG